MLIALSCLAFLVSCEPSPTASETAKAAGDLTRAENDLLVATLALNGAIEAIEKAQRAGDSEAEQRARNTLLLEAAEAIKVAHALIEAAHAVIDSDGDLDRVIEAAEAVQVIVLLISFIADDAGDSALAEEASILAGDTGEVLAKAEAKKK